MKPRTFNILWVAFVVILVMSIAQCSSNGVQDVTPKAPAMAKSEPASGELRYKTWCVGGMEVFEIGAGTGNSTYVPHYKSEASNGIVVSCSTGTKK